MSNIKLSQEELDSLLDLDEDIIDKDGDEAEGEIEDEVPAEEETPPPKRQLKTGEVEDFKAKVAMVPQAPRFQDFAAPQKEGIIIEVTAELGRTIRKIEEIMEFVPGIVVELDKMADEPVNIMANGRLVAKGEVVVVDEHFGIKLTNFVDI